MLARPAETLPPAGAADVDGLLQSDRVVVSPTAATWGAPGQTQQPSQPTFGHGQPLAQPSADEQLFAATRRCHSTDVLQLDWACKRHRSAPEPERGEVGVVGTPLPEMTPVRDQPGEPDRIWIQPLVHVALSGNNLAALSGS